MNLKRNQNNLLLVGLGLLCVALLVRAGWRIAATNQHPGVIIDTDEIEAIKMQGRKQLNDLEERRMSADQKQSKNQEAQAGQAVRQRNNRPLSALESK